MDPCVVAGNALSTLNPRPKHDLFTPTAALHLPQFFSLNSASLCHGNRLFRLSIARRRKGSLAGKTYALVLEWVPHPPASARLSRGRVWCAKLGLPSTSQQSLCRYIYLPQHPPWCSTPTRPLHHPFPCTLELEHLPSLHPPHPPLSKGSSRCSARHDTIAAATHRACLACQYSRPPKETLPARLLHVYTRVRSPRIVSRLAYSPLVHAQWNAANAIKQCIKTRPLHANTPDIILERLPIQTIVLISIPNIVRHASCRMSSLVALPSHATRAVHAWTRCTCSSRIANTSARREPSDSALSPTRMTRTPLQRA